MLLRSRTHYPYYSLLLCCLPSGEAANTNFIVFALTRPGIEPTIYHTRCELDVDISLILDLLEALLVVVFYLYIYALQTNKQTNKQIYIFYLLTYGKDLYSTTI